MSTEAPAKPIITKNSSEFKLDAYASIPAGELVVFAVQVLQADAAPVAVEEVVSICFRFFPHSFALKNYFYWPDSALVSRRLHDAKEKGLLKGSPTDGYETKVQGRQVAKHVARTLGVSLPVPPKVEVVVPAVETKEEVPAEKKEADPSALVIVKTAKKRETRKKEVRQKAAKPEKKPAIKKPAAKLNVQAKPKKQTVKAAAPVKKKHAPKPKVQPKTLPKKIVKPAAKVKVKVKQKPGKPAPKPKVTVEKKPVVKAVEKKRETSKVVKPAVKLIVKKAEPKVEKKAKKKEAKSQPRQLTMPLTPPAAWKKAQVPATKPAPKKEAPLSGDKKPVKGEVLTPAAVSKEEKDKAAKVIKQLERSDAYQLYRRNGKRAQIGEFDFRNMLFATMESSAETLKRNVELFKRYAGIHFRTDLIAFLEFCEENFSVLLMPKAKVKGKR